LHAGGRGDKGAQVRAFLQNYLRYSCDFGPVPGDDGELLTFVPFVNARLFHEEYELRFVCLFVCVCLCVCVCVCVCGCKSNQSFSHSVCLFRCDPEYFDLYGLSKDLCCKIDAFKEATDHFPGMRYMRAKGKCNVVCFVRPNLLSKFWMRRFVPQLRNLQTRERHAQDQFPQK
jgi:hypothetical protein